MTLLKNLLAEDPWPLVGLFALGALILGIAMFATGRGKYLVGIVALVALSVLVLMVDALWLTDRERIDQIVDQLADAVRREDAAAIVPYLSSHCRYGTLDPSGIERLARSVFQAYDIERLSLSNRKTEVFPLREEATSEFLAVVRGKQGGTEFSPYPTRWILTFTKDKEGHWKVLEIQQISAFGESRQPLALPGGPVLP